MSKHVMIDLETLGTTPFSAILSLGAVKFDPNDPTDKGEALYVLVDPISCTKHGLRMDADTVMWWMQPERAAARQEFLDGLKYDLQTMCAGFVNWFSPPEQRVDGKIVSLPVWGNGAAFDNVILRSAFQAAGVEPPWSFHDDRCFRTMKNLPKAKALEPERSGTHHNALHDAVHQAVWLQKIVRYYRLAI